MFNLKPYFCPKCGSTYHYKECLRSEHRMYCRHCSSKKICLSGLVILMVAATLGLAYIVPNIVYYKLHGKLQYGLIRGEQYLFLPAIAAIALMGVMRILQQKSREKRGAEGEDEPAPGMDPGETEPYIPPDDQCGENDEKTIPNGKG